MGGKEHFYQIKKICKYLDGYRIIRNFAAHTKYHI